MYVYKPFSKNTTQKERESIKSKKTCTFGQKSKCTCREQNILRIYIKSSDNFWCLLYINGQSPSPVDQDHLMQFDQPQTSRKRDC